MCVCVCVCVCIWAVFLNTYFIKQYRHLLSTHFFISLFKLLHWFYGSWRELVNETSTTNWYPRTFCLILGHHQGCLYCKSNVTFAWTLLLCKCFFILVCCSIIYIYIYIYIYFKMNGSKRGFNLTWKINPVVDLFILNYSIFSHWTNKRNFIIYIYIYIYIYIHKWIQLHEFC